MALVALTSVILTVFAILIIKLIQKYDHEHGISITKRTKWYFMILFFLLLGLLRVKYGSGLNFYFYSYLVFYLSVCAFIDWQTQNVYDFLHYITIGTGVIYLFLKGGQLKNIALVLLQVIILFLLIIVWVKKGMLGGGDGFLLVASSFFLLSPNHVISIEIPLVNVLLANVIFVITNMRRFDFRKLKMKEKVPFVPSIAASTYVILLVL